MCMIQNGSNQEVLKEGWHYARELVRHEHDLANHRLVAFLSIHGFLFAALFVGFSAFINELGSGYRILTSGLLLLVSLIGYTCSWLIEPWLRGAFRHVHATELWWQKFARDENYRENHPFPTLIGNRAKHRKFLMGLFGQYADLDEPYSELDFHPNEQALIDIEVPTGIPRLPGLMLKWWAIIFVLALALIGWQVWSSVASSQPASITKISIVESSKGKRTSIKFDRESSGVQELKRRLNTIA